MKIEIIMKSIAIKLTVFSFLILSNVALFSQKSKMTPHEYITNFKDIAVREMYYYKIPASITLAQGLLESGNGNSKLASEGNNHFGIKCKKEWLGDSMHVDDDKKHECFRVYDDAEKSYRDHSLFLTSRKWYEPLFEYEITDYKKWAYGLKKAGYATDPKYPQRLISLIEKNKLYQFDTMIYRKPEPIALNEEEKIKINVNKPEEVQTTVATSNIDLEKEKEYNVIGYPKQRVKEKNGVSYVVAEKNQSIKDIARQNSMLGWQLYFFNDMKYGGKIVGGQIVYLQRKKKKNLKKRNYEVEEGDSYWGISQRYGIRLKSLCKMNELEKDSKIVLGTSILLQPLKQ